MELLILAINFLREGVSLAKNHNLYCPKCGGKLWYSQSDKSYRCSNPSCPRSSAEGSKVDEVRSDVDDQVGALFE